MNTTFKTTTHAKCILAGEHSVLRNYTLLAKSIKSYYLEFIHTDGPLNVELHLSQPSAENNFHAYFLKLIRRAHELSHQDIKNLNGNFILKSNIPLSAGLGFSAAISLAVTNWALDQQWIKEYQQFEFAKNLEDMFHGESSGADIAACLSDDIIIYKKNCPVVKCHSLWKPKLYIQNTSLKSVTSVAIQKVLHLQQQKPKLAHSLDEKMNQAALIIKASLEDASKSAIDELAKGINQAYECFETWGLIPDELRKQIKKLQRLGAIAVKPTGAGDGGSLLSLWQEEPEDKFKQHLIAVF